jgi:hypothetical protein
MIYNYPQQADNIYNTIIELVYDGQVLRDKKEKGKYILPEYQIWKVIEKINISHIDENHPETLLTLKQSSIIPTQEYPLRRRSEFISIRHGLGYKQLIHHYINVMKSYNKYFKKIIINTSKKL